MPILEFEGGNDWRCYVKIITKMPLNELTLALRV